MTAFDDDEHQMAEWIAVSLAVALCLAEEADTVAGDQPVSRWAYAGRLEAQGLAVRPDRLTGSWRI